MNAGGSLKVSGAGFDPGSTVELLLSSESSPVATVKVAADGTFETTIHIPADATGHETLSAKAPEAPCDPNPIVLIVNGGSGGGGGAGGTPGSGGGLANTGTDVLEFAEIAAVLIAVGGAVNFAGRRQHRPRHAAPAYYS